MTKHNPKNVYEDTSSDEISVAQWKSPISDLDEVDKLMLQFTNIEESELWESKEERYWI